MLTGDSLKMGRLTREGVDALFKRRRVANQPLASQISNTVQVLSVLSVSPVTQVSHGAVDEPFVRVVCVQLGAADPLPTPTPRSVRVRIVKEARTPYETQPYATADGPSMEMTRRHRFFETPLAGLAAAALRPVWWPCKSEKPCRVSMPIVLVRHAPEPLLREIRRAWAPLELARYDGTNIPVCGVLSAIPSVKATMCSWPPRRHGPTVVFLDASLHDVESHDVLPWPGRVLEVSVAADAALAHDLLETGGATWEQVARALHSTSSVDPADGDVDLLFDVVLRGVPLEASRVLSGDVSACRTRVSWLKIDPEIDWLSSHA